MIIRQNGTFETNSMFPNVDWYNEGNFIIDETTEEGQQLAQLYVDNYPFIDFEHDGENVTKVVLLDKPERPEEVEGKEIQLVQNEQGEWEYIYVDIPLTKEQELEKKVRELQEIVDTTLGVTE